jgi:hypothetical protein
MRLSQFRGLNPETKKNDDEDLESHMTKSRRISASDHNLKLNAVGEGEKNSLGSAGSYEELQRRNTIEDHQSVEKTMLHDHFVIHADVRRKC